MLDGYNKGDGMYDSKLFGSTVFVDPSVAAASTLNVTSCLAENTSLNRKNSPVDWVFAGIGVECGYFVYAQPAESDDNFYVLPSDVRACPTSFADVSVYNVTSSGGGAVVRQPSSMSSSSWVILLSTTVALIVPLFY